MAKNLRAEGVHIGKVGGTLMLARFNVKNTFAAFLFFLFFSFCASHNIIVKSQVINGAWGLILKIDFLPTSSRYGG